MRLTISVHPTQIRLSTKMSEIEGLAFDLLDQRELRHLLLFNLWYICRRLALKYYVM